MIAKLLVDKGFDFQVRMPDELTKVFEALYKITDKTLESDNQKLNLIDYHLWEAVLNLNPNDIIVQDVARVLKGEDSQVDNQGFDTKLDMDNMLSQGSLFDQPEFEQPETEYTDKEKARARALVKIKLMKLKQKN